MFNQVSYVPVFPVLLLAIQMALTNPAYAYDPTTSLAKLIEPAQVRSLLESRNCLPLFGLQGERYQCGFLQVPEDYTNQDSDLIKVPFLMIYPEEDVYDNTLTPLLITGGGGPGSALLGNRFFSLDDDSFWTYEEFSVVDGRLLVILENRGVGHSVPNLDCHYTPEIYQQQYWSALLDADLACGLEHVSKDIDLTQYNVQNATLDIEMLRRLLADQELSINQINLYGVSYGTRVAMYYERMFPDATRSMILDSVSVNEQDGTALELAYAQRSLDLVFSKCRSDTRCRESFGENLEFEFYTFLSNVDTLDVSLEIRWPGEQLPVSVPLTATMVVDVLHGALYGSDTFATIPQTARQLIDESYQEFTLALNAFIESYAIGYAFYDTAFLTYLCFDSDYSSESENHDSTPEPKLEKYWDTKRAREYMRRVCSNYGAVSATDLLRTPFISDTPVLLLSGDLDPVTPPASALKAAVNYSYHWHITRESASHDVISHSACARFLASWFLYHLQEDLESRLKECEPEAALDFFMG